MPFSCFSNIRIAGIASSVPKTVVKIDGFKPLFGEEVVDKFKKMTGISEYRKTNKEQTASDLGFSAAKALFKNKGIDPNSIGALIFVSHSPDYRRPATACVLHKRLGLKKDCFAFDISLGCSASVYGIVATCSLMQNSDIGRALLVVAESITKMIHPQDRSLAMLFGDAGSAILLEKTEYPSEIKGLLRTDGSNYKAVIAPAGGFRNMDASTESMRWPDGNTRTLYNTYMNGADVFSFTISDIPQTVIDFMSKTDTSVVDYDCFAFHQANQFIHKQISKKLKIPFEKMPLSLDRFGNTSGPSVPLTLCDSYGEEKHANSLKVMMCGFGVGLSWGVVSALLDTREIFPVIETDSFFEEGLINSPDQL